jgi:predicted secreted protein
MGEVVITEADLGSTRSVKVADTVVLRLAEIPTTGFRWAPAEMESNILEPAGDDFELNPQSAVGGGGVRVFRFLATKAGQSNLNFSLTRSWEPGSPRSQFHVTVNVQSPH